MLRGLGGMKSGLHGFERRATAAGPRGTGVDDPESRSGETVLVIQGAAIQKLKAGGIEKNTDSQMGDLRVFRLPGTEGHGVLQPRASSLFHGKPQALGMVVLPGQVLKCLCGDVSNRDHVLFL